MINFTVGPVTASEEVLSIGTAALFQDGRVLRNYAGK